MSIALNRTLYDRGITNPLLWRACKDLQATRQFEPGRFSRAVQLVHNPTATLVEADGTNRLIGLTLPGSKAGQRHLVILLATADNPNGDVVTCDCQDYHLHMQPIDGIAPLKHWNCKHRIAALIIRRAIELAQAAEQVAATVETVQPPNPAPNGQPVYDDINEEYVVCSAVTGRQYYGRSSSEAIGRMQEADRVWAEHESKPQNQGYPNGGDNGPKT